MASKLRSQDLNSDLLKLGRVSCYSKLPHSPSIPVRAHGSLQCLNYGFYVLSVSPVFLRSLSPFVCVCAAGEVAGGGNSAIHLSTHLWN